MIIKTNEFTKIIPKTCIYEVIRVTEENMKRIYNYLHENGCKVFPDERQSAGQIWLYDKDTQDCIAYTDEDFNEIDWLEYEYRK